MSYRYLLDLALILLSTKVLSLVTKRFKLPQVVGSLLAGLILGPAVLNIIHETDFIKQLAEVGVIVLLFNAGLESNLSEFKKSGKTSFIVAVMGVMIPLIGGTILAYCINPSSTSLVNLFPKLKSWAFLLKHPLQWKLHPDTNKVAATPNPLVESKALISA